MPDGMNPFGEPDGAKPDFKDLRRTFVEFDDERAWGGLATRPSDLSARVLVGRKGSGKTLYLRRQRDSAAQSDDLFAARREQSPPDTELILKFANTTKGHERTELWKLVWNRAILRATLSHLLAEDSLRAQLDPRLANSLLQDYRELFEQEDPSHHTLGVFSELKHFLQRDRTFHDIDRYLHSDKWAHLKEDLKTAFRQSRPVCFYLDAVDEYYEAAPRLWLECQVGLFLAVMELLRDERFSSRLHVFVCLRDAVILRVLRSEHSTRYVNERYVRILEWDYKATRILLEHKIGQLPTELLTKPGLQNPVERWLGQSDRFVETRGQSEAITQYLLRHTRLLPRDVIIQGNILCHELAIAGWFPDLSDGADPIREGVSAASSRFGRELLDRCAQHILADMMPEDAAQRGYSSTYLQKAAGLHEDVLTKLRTFLAEDVKVERFSNRRLVQLEIRAAATFASDTDVMSALWLNGLIGFVDSAKSGCGVFYSHRHAHDLFLPKGKKEFVLHSCLIDSVGIRPRGGPVVQCV
jgi:hypothetical protein